MSLKNGYFLEPSRQARMLNRKLLVQNLPNEQLPDGQMQSMSPTAWCQEPIEPEKRQTFHSSIREIFVNTPQLFTTRANLIANNDLRMISKSNGVSVSKAEQQRADELEASRPLESHDKEAAQARLSLQNVKDNRIAGLKQKPGQGLRMNFFVFIQDEIEEDLLGSFLETIPEAPVDTVSYRYAFVLAGDPKAKNLDDEYQFTTTKSDYMSTQCHLQAELADLDEAPPQTPINPDQAATPVDNASTAKSYYSTLRTCMRRVSPFLNAPLQDIHDTWTQLIQPYSCCRSFYSTHAYIVLDEKTAADWDTVLVVSETDGTTQRRRVDFRALREQIVLKGLDNLDFDITQLPTDQSGTIRGPIMAEAVRLDNWSREKERQDSERYYANDDVQLEDVDAFFKAQKQKELELQKAKDEDRNWMGMKRAPTNMFKKKDNGKEKRNDKLDTTFLQQPSSNQPSPMNLRSPLETLGDTDSPMTKSKKSSWFSKSKTGPDPMSAISPGGGAMEEVFRERSRSRSGSPSIPLRGRRDNSTSRTNGRTPTEPRATMMDDNGLLTAGRTGDASGTSSPIGDTLGSSNRDDRSRQSSRSRGRGSSTHRRGDQANEDEPQQKTKRTLTFFKKDKKDEKSKVPPVPSLPGGNTALKDTEEEDKATLKPGKMSKLFSRKKSETPLVAT